MIVAASSENTEKAKRGTDIIMYINAEEKDFLEENKLQDLLTKYCKFLPIEIVFGKKKNGYGTKDLVPWDTIPGRISDNLLPSVRMVYVSTADWCHVPYPFECRLSV